MTRELRLLPAVPGIVDFDWIAAGYHRLIGTPDGAIFIDVDGKRYRLVTWYGAAHFKDSLGQVWMTRADFERNEWVEVDL